MARTRHPRWKGQQPKKVVLVATVTSLIIVGAFLYLLYVTANPVPNLPIDWRVHLVILDARTKIPVNRTIPAGIGVLGGIWLNHTWDSLGPQGYAPLSTRDSTGTIYIQSVRPTFFVLGQFFNIWGQPLNRTCVWDYCSSPGGNPPPFISTGDQEHCLSWSIPLDNTKTLEIVIGSTLAAAQCS